MWRPFSSASSLLRLYVMKEFVMSAPKPISVYLASGMSRRTGWMTGTRQGVSMLFPPTFRVPILPIRSVSLTSKVMGMLSRHRGRWLSKSSALRTGMNRASY